MSYFLSSPLFQISLSQMEAHQRWPPPSYTLSERETLCILDPLNQKTPLPAAAAAARVVPRPGEKVSTDKRSLSGSQREAGLSLR